MTEPWNWNYTDLEKLINNMESIRLDFKESRLFDDSREKIVANLTREISAFANTEGGTIVIGITEKRDGRARIAGGLDKGLDFIKWPPELLQQLLVSNIRPFLTGLRIHPIILNSDKTRCYYVIYVPQGTTAYQASDFRYYGRAEHEIKPLPDHEIRLLMTRGKLPSAIVEINDFIEDEVMFNPQKATGGVIKQIESIFDKNSLQEESLMVKRYRFSLCLKNTGEINITEYKVLLNFPSENSFELDPYSRTVKDGWAEYGYGPSIGSEQGRPLKVNIFPGDTQYIREYEFVLPRNKFLTDIDLFVDWTLFLRNTLPISGRIDLVKRT